MELWHYIINMKRLLMFCLSGLLAGSMLMSQQPVKDSWYEKPEDLVKDIYRVVSAKPGENVDWVKVRSMFIDEAVVILRTSRDKSTRFTADGFIQDFKNFYADPRVQASGFEEKILSMKVMAYTDIAFIATVYSAAITGSQRPATRGIDLWLLSRQDGLWKITSVVNEVIPPGQDLPDLPEWKF